MNNDEHVVIVVVGRTGSGKSSLIKKVCERANATQLISFTTRPKRSEEDVDHIFVTEEKYKKQKEIGDIIAETEISGYHYYAIKNQIYDADFYTLDPIGLEVLKSMNLPNLKIVTVYITCPDDIREQRALKRGDDKRVYRIRNHAESTQFRHFVAAEKWDYAISNIDFAKAYSCLKHIFDIEGVWKNNIERKKDNG